MQAAAPGTPVIYAPVIAPMDPRSGMYAAGAVEHGVICAAGTEMARYYGLPAESSGFCTQTFEPDLQTAWEKANGGLLVTLSDPDILVGPGLLAGATSLCLEQIVLDVEEWRLACQARTGVPVSDELWLDDVLERVGPCGSFLGERSTRTNTRSGEWRLSDFGVHGSRDAWQAAGAPTTLEYAHAEGRGAPRWAALAAARRRRARRARRAAGARRRGKRVATKARRLPMTEDGVIRGVAGWQGSAPLHPYLVVDVFTREPLQGNQLGVFLDGRPFSSG